MNTEYKSIAVGRVSRLALCENGDVLSVSESKAAIFTDAMAISCSWEHSLILKNDGTVWSYSFCTGCKQIIELQNITAISCSRRNNLALRNDGIVFAWGPNNEGQLGNGTNAEDAYSKIPVAVIDLDEVVSISCGGIHCLALRKDGVVWSWGYNGHGQLGNGKGGNISNVPVKALLPSNVIGISAGHLHSLALLDDGAVYSFGWNKAGQLGDGTSFNRSTPVFASALSGEILLRQLNS